MVDAYERGAEETAFRRVAGSRGRGVGNMDDDVRAHLSSTTPETGVGRERTRASGKEAMGARVEGW